MLTFATVLVTFSLLDNSKTLFLKPSGVYCRFPPDTEHDFTGLFLGLPAVALRWSLSPQHWHMLSGSLLSAWFPGSHGLPLASPGPPDPGLPFQLIDELCCQLEVAVLKAIGEAYDRT